MQSTFLVLVILLLLLAAVLTQEPFVFSILYIITAVFLLDLFWKRQVGKSIDCRRVMQSRAFPDEEVQVKLKINNRSFFPLVWGRIREGLPPGTSLRLYHQVISLAPKQEQDLTYSFKIPKRGMYEIGPLNLTNGDLMGFSKDQTQTWDSQPLIVYPRVYPLTKLGLPSVSPLGNKKHHQPIFEDPTRPIGKREYIPGDSQRRIDWKSSAVTGALQVKVFEPAVSMETAIFLDLNLAAYSEKRYFDAIELAISTAASVSNYVVEAREGIGFFSNGKDPLAVDHKSQKLNPAKGVTTLMQILENLARIEAHQTNPIEDLMHQEAVRLSWGTTLVLITGHAPQTIFDNLIQAQRLGLQTVLILAGEIEAVDGIKAKAKSLKILCHHLLYTQDLKGWQG